MRPLRGFRPEICGLWMDQNPGYAKKWTEYNRIKACSEIPHNFTLQPTIGPIGQWLLMLTGSRFIHCRWFLFFFTQNVSGITWHCKLLGAGLQTLRKAWFFVDDFPTELTSIKSSGISHVWKHLEFCSTKYEGLNHHCYIHLVRGTCPPQQFQELIYRNGRIKLLYVKDERI